MVKKDKAYKERMKLKKQQRLEDINENRDEHERRLESLQIIHQLQQNNIDSKLPGIRKLIDTLSEYVMNGEEKDITIPLPEMNKNIKCYLPLNKNSECVVVLKHID